MLKGNEDHKKYILKIHSNENKAISKFEVMILED